MSNLRMLKPGLLMTAISIVKVGEASDPCTVTALALTQWPGHLRMAGMFFCGRVLLGYSGVQLAP